MTRHTRKDALDARAFELLMEGAWQLDEYFSLEARFVILVAGRLGLRAGEIAHMDASWIDWRRRMIEIPAHHPCEKGRDGGRCGYCRQAAAEKAARDETLAPDAALEQMWTPKTDHAAREIPLDANQRAEIVVEQYFDRFDAYQNSRISINRRVERAAEAAPELDAADVYPHALRASAASLYAGRGLDIFALQSMFGWADLSTPMKYIRANGDHTARKLRQSSG
jgi:integrase